MLQEQKSLVQMMSMTHRKRDTFRTIGKMNHESNFPLVRSQDEIKHLQFVKILCLPEKRVAVRV